MSAGINDFFTKVGEPGNATFLASPGHSIGGVSWTVDSTGLWPTDTAVIFAVDTVTVVGTETHRVEGTYTVWRGLVTSATTIGSAVLMYGTDQNYAASSSTRVYILPTSSRENRIIDGLLTSLDQDGTLKDGAVDNAAVLASNVVTTIKMLDANVTTAKLATSATTSDKLATDANVISYVEGLTTGQSTTSASYVDATGITLTFTTPLSCTKVLLKCEGPISCNTAGVSMFLAITNGSNAIQVERTKNSGGASTGLIDTFNLSRRITVTANTSYTFKLRFASNGVAAAVINQGNSTDRPTCLWVERA